MKPKFSSFKNEVATDEVGRGCLAGPVVAAAVILPENFYHADIKDSKKLSFKKRKSLSKIIKQNALHYSIKEVNPIIIDSINILQASVLAMHNAINELNTKIEFIIVDGNYFKKYKNIEHQCIIKGDNNFMNIAAASIIAKVHRDNLMIELDHIYPEYDWKNNKGYPTKKHREAISTYGITPYHRKSFKLI